MLTIECVTCAWQGLEDVVGITYCGWDYVRLGDRNEDYKVSVLWLQHQGSCLSDGVSQRLVSHTPRWRHCAAAPGLEVR